MFDGSNFQQWKFQITAVLKMKEVFDVVTGIRVKSENAEGANRALTETWETDDAKATTIIFSPLESRQLDPILVCTSAKEIWDNLGQIHEQKSVSNKLVFIQRFHAYRMDLTDSIVQHIAKVRNLGGQLKDVGAAVTDITIMAQILASLTTKYSSFVTAWDSVDSARQTIDSLCERLIREETRLGAENDGVSALMVSRLNVSKTSGEKKSKDDKKKATIEEECRVLSLPRKRTLREVASNKRKRQRQVQRQKCSRSVRRCVRVRRDNEK